MDAVAAVQGLRDRQSGGGGVALRFVDLGPGEGFAVATAGASGSGPSATILAGQLVTSTVAAPLEAAGSGHACSYVLVQNDPASSVAISVGTATSQEKVLQPGAIAVIAALNTAQIYVKSASGTPNADWLAGIAVGDAITSMTDTAAALATHACTEVLLQADLANTVNILIGDSANQYIALPPGASRRLAVVNSNLVYVKAASAVPGVTLYYQCLANLAAIPAGIGGAVTVADGADGTQGSTTDLAWSSGAGTTIALLKAIAGSAGGTGLSITDATTWAAASSKFVPVGGVYNDAAAALTTGQEGTRRSTPNRAGHVNLRTNAGVELGTTGAPVNVALPAATVVTLTPPAAITGYALDSSLAVLDADLALIDADLKTNITLHAGTHIIGKVTTDQTTHGTTDLVAADVTKVGGGAYALGAAATAASAPVTIASDQIVPVSLPAAAAVQAVLAATAATYAAGNAVGGAALVLANAVRANGGTGVIQSLVVMDGTHQNAALDILLFNAAPTTTPTDMAAYSLSAVDLPALIGKIKVPSTAYDTYGASSVAMVGNLNLVFKAGVATTSIYAVAVTQGTPTYTANCLEITLGILRR